MCDQVYVYDYGQISTGQRNEILHGLKNLPTTTALKEPPKGCIEMEDDTMLCEKCYDNICTIRTRLDNFREDIDGMTPRDKKYYCEEMASMLKEYDVVANEVNLDLKIDECFRANKRLVK